GSNDEFTVEIHHGGFFIGSGAMRSYVDGKISWFDHCEIDTWSALWFDDFIVELGYEKTETLKVYWLLPFKGLDDGLRILSSDEDTNAMCSVVDRVKNLVLYFDHDSDLGRAGFDHVQSEAMEEQHTGPGNVDTEATPSSDEDSEDTDFVDTDNEIDEGDEDIRAEEEDTIATRVKKRKKAAGSMLKATGVSMNATVSDDSTDDDLDLPEEMMERNVKLKFTRFAKEDYSDPKFKVGMVFDTVESLRKAISEYSMKNRVEIKLPRNDKRRLRAHCSIGCPRNLYASYDSRAKSFMIKTYVPTHNCQREWNLKRCTSKWLAEKYLESFRGDDKMTLTNFSRTVQREWNLAPSRSKLARARRLAMQVIYGDESEQYNRLWDYGQQLRTSNPGSSFILKVVNNHFSSCYMSLDACKRGFLSGCRPIICLDGCHIKTKFGGQILTAVGIDPNDCIYPIAMAVVEVEAKATWKWFLEKLKEDLKIENTYPWTIMTDKQKGLIPAVEEVFPKSEHRFYVRHLYSNFKDAGFKGEVLKNQLWTCARASTENKWQYHMEKMKVLNKDAHAWLEKMAPNTWVRAFFSEFPKSDILLNNNCEVFNKYILEARELPMLSMLERIKQQLMTRYYKKQQEVAEFVGTICPKIRKKVAKFAEFANVCYVMPSGSGVFQVLDREFQYIVDIGSRTCDCRKWNLTGIPCQHAISCLRHERIPPESVVHDCYSIESFKMAYGTNIKPCKDITCWEKVEGTQVLPPVYEKKVGRPPRCRRKEPHEKQGKNGATMSKHGTVMTCSYCRGENHNARGCRLKKLGVRPEDYVPNEVPLDDKIPEHHDADQAEQMHMHEIPDQAEQMHVHEAELGEQVPSSQWNTQGAPEVEEMTQPVNVPAACSLMSQMSSTMLMQMMEQGKQLAISSIVPQPLPDSVFIDSNRPLPRPAPLTTATKQGRNTARKMNGAPPKKKGAPLKKKGVPRAKKN
ncbi:hypothetical protein U9M48_012129, partial [Paspalum notatum var. saurae]